ncbi:Cdk-activating kinase assembly factor MAT1, centre [Kalmanozyma brasiliensis GHG001]|uniref:RNA polymerase II transcription factor B subunit 3 n=1 Tax=Kalmanozyma brasiliensis (strain GHG001) TaxID=1365824 RepID=V5GKX2_KALBG|nr:Cdk-activating kinase assembly factor MAT1, centre [Kalmanozyma brasiliensis GHG001]EST06602.1 Cdk-activating kinase assembly factor MAT1, centre [Kalmanozyma brasiliensis GHG001]
MSTMRRTGSGRPSTSTTTNRPGGPSRPNAPAAPGARAIFDKSRRIEEFSSSDDKCPQCKTDRYLNPRLRLLVSPCYHKMCESCIDRIFSLGPAPCPECGKKVSKVQFTAQTFQDLGVEREVAVRRTVAKLFNRREDDFVDLKAYNDYLEEVEEITFNLIHEIDLPRTNAKLEQYQAAHRSAIASSASISQQESDRQARVDEEEKQAKKARAERVRKQEEVEREERDRERLEMMRELETGADPDEIMEKQRKRRVQREEKQRLQDLEAARREKEAAQISANGGSGAADALDRRPWSVDMLLDFEGPLAYLDDASALFDVHKAPAALGGLEGVKGAAGYEDPWLSASWVTKEQIARYRAGGYDWERQVWTRGLCAACECIGAAPLTDNGIDTALPSMEVDP